MEQLGKVSQAMFAEIIAQDANVIAQAKAANVIALQPSPYVLTKDTFGAYSLTLGRMHLWWRECRELFHIKMLVNKNENAFFYGCDAKHSKRIVAFVRKVEKKLGLSRSERVAFTSTTGNAIAITASEWWREEHRFQFLTIIIRAGQNYKGDNFKKRLYENEYTKDTPHATKRFMEGHTKLNTKEKFKGWVSFFHGRKPKKAKELLV